MNKVLWILILLVLAGYGYVILSLVRAQPITNNRLQSAIDSMVVHDRIRDSAIRAIDNRVFYDSIRVSIIRKELTDKIALQAIKNHYDTKKQHIDTLATDEQLELFSGNLSPQGSHR